MHYRRFAAFVLFIGLGAYGCGSESNTTSGTGGAGGATGGAGGAGGGNAGAGGSAGGTNCSNFNYTNYNPTMSPTLKNDIQPIITISCALASSCHQNNSSHHPWLGPGPSMLDGGKLTDQQAAAIVMELSKPSAQVANRNIMVPGKPEDSYVMNKLEGTNNCPSFTCMGPDKCGAQMPDPRMTLEPAQLELIRAWIKKGAPL